MAKPRDEAGGWFVNRVMVGVAIVQEEAPAVLEGVGRERSVQEADASFESLYRTHYRDVFRYALLMLRGFEEAEDVTAEVFGKALAAWRDGRGPEGEALPWLLLIARRTVIDRGRRRRLISWLPLDRLHPAQEPADDSGTGRTEFWVWFDRFAGALSDRQREVLILRYRRDLEDEQIGRIMGISPSAVRSLVARACEALRRNPEIWQ
jgi:RNA polymerase sigma factor (sigma-70 family)